MTKREARAVFQALVGAQFANPQRGSQVERLRNELMRYFAEPEPRRIVQLSSFPASEAAGKYVPASILALCEDGTLWTMSANPGELEWYPLPGVPEGVPVPPPAPSVEVDLDLGKEKPRDNKRTPRVG